MASHNMWFKHTDIFVVLTNAMTHTSPGTLKTRLILFRPMSYRFMPAHSIAVIGHFQALNTKKKFPHLLHWFILKISIL